MNDIKLVPALVTAVLHGVAISFLLFGMPSNDRVIEIKAKPLAIQAKLVIEKPVSRPAKPTPVAKPIPKPVAKPEPVKKPEPKPEVKPVPKPVPKPRRSRARTISPTPVMDTRQVASEALQLLSNRQVDQATARREKYRSWFPAN